MLTYLITVTTNLFIPAVLIGLAFAFAGAFLGKWGRRILGIGLGVGVLAAAIRAIVTNTTRVTAGWKIPYYGYWLVMVTVAATVLMIAVFAVRPLRKKVGDKGMDVVHYVVAGLLAAAIAALLFCVLPSIMAAPFQFNLNGNSVLSTDFLYRLGGYLLGLIICVVAGFGVECSARICADKGMRPLVWVLLLGALALVFVQYFANAMSQAIVRRLIGFAKMDPEARSNMFIAVSAIRNGASGFLYAFAAWGLIPSAALLMRGFTLKEPYETSAERRRQKATWRRGRRWSVVLAACFAVAILTCNVFVTLNTVKIEEAPLEQTEIVKDAMGNDYLLRVPLDMVVDGHLHRFGYTTPDGTVTRFIVVLKQEGTSNYGVGLDACEVCGEAGYYEQKGQIICKKCQVVMNKTTIGMKGGCNPIIIDYDIDDYYITVPVAEMAKEETVKRFKK